MTLNNLAKLVLFIYLTFLIENQTSVAENVKKRGLFDCPPGLFGEFCDNGNQKRSFLAIIYLKTF